MSINFVFGCRSNQLNSEVLQNESWNVIPEITGGQHVLENLLWCHEI
jgi:hypothetical protein